MIRCQDSKDKKKGKAEQKKKNTDSTDKRLNDKKK